MRIPHKCPVCDGQGIVSKPPWVAGDQDTWIDSTTGPHTCPKCTGEKVIWDEEVTDQEQEEPEPLEETEWVVEGEITQNATWIVKAHTKSGAHSQFPINIDYQELLDFKPRHVTENL